MHKLTRNEEVNVRESVEGSLIYGKIEKIVKHKILTKIRKNSVFPAKYKVRKMILVYFYKFLDASNTIKLRSLQIVQFFRYSKKSQNF